MEPQKTFLDLRTSCNDVDGAPGGDASGERREFLLACSATLLAAVASSPLSANTAPQIKRYQASILSDEQGRPMRAAELKPLTNYLFHYPFVATPCLLIDMGRDVGGVGKRKSIVAFSAICSHKLAYPAREVAFIRFQASASKHSEAERIHCCADHSVYDPSANAKVVAGPAPAPLAAIALSYDAKTDQIRALGTAGTEQFDAFFAKYDFKLSMEYGGKARQQSAAATRVQELSLYCRNVAQC
ncbi:MAG: (2Fe-2S)-binding protein [Betaproteobacteria bacterium]|nr:MAG: (2Fe-2S)-binding protein [Betaproteobacteria bacterium]